MLAYGGKYASLFSDPTEMGMNFHYTLAMPYALVLNVFILLPANLALLVYLLIKKELHRDTVILCLLNILIFYFIPINLYVFLSIAFYLTSSDKTTRIDFMKNIINNFTEKPMIVPPIV